MPTATGTNLKCTGKWKNQTQEATWCMMPIIRHYGKYILIEIMGKENVSGAGGKGEADTE